MIFSELTKTEKKVAIECLNAVSYGPFCPDDLYNTLLGYYKSEFKQVLSSLPNIDEESIKFRNIIRAALFHITYFPRGFHRDVSDIIYSKYFTVQPECIKKLFYKYIGKRPPEPRKWDGIVCGAITRKAVAFWNGIDKIIQNELLTHVWCTHCSKHTTITNFESYINRENHMILNGFCVKCFKCIQLEIKPDTVNDIKIQEKKNELKRNIWLPQENS